MWTPALGRFWRKKIEKKQFDLDGINENTEEKAARAKGVGAHLSAYNKKKGDPVIPGEIVAYVGNTGNSAGAHLHLEVFICDNKIKKEDVIDPNADENTEMKWAKKTSVWDRATQRVNPFNHDENKG